MSDITNIAVSAGNVVPVDTLGGQVTVKVNSGGPVYYADNAQVSSANNQGSITAGNSVTFSAPQFITGAAGVQASVTLTLFAGSSTAPGAPKDVVLGSDGLVGGPGGTGLTTSAAIVSSANVFTAVQTFDTSATGGVRALVVKAHSVNGSVTYASFIDSSSDVPGGHAVDIVNSAIPAGTTAGGIVLYGSAATSATKRAWNISIDQAAATPNRDLGIARENADGTDKDCLYFNYGDGIAAATCDFYGGNGGNAVTINAPTNSVGDPATLVLRPASNQTAAAFAVQNGQGSTQNTFEVLASGKTKIQASVPSNKTASDGVTNTDTSLTSATIGFVKSDEGRYVTGTGIPAGTYIQNYVSATAVTLSQATTATATGIALTVYATSFRVQDNNVAPFVSLLGTTTTIRNTQVSVGPGAIPNESATLGVRALGTNNATFKLATASWGNFQITANGTSPGDVLAQTTNATALKLGTNGTTALAIDTSQNLTVTDAKNVILGTTTGTKIGTATTQKLGFFNATPVVQPSGTPVASTDLASVIALANSLRTNLLALGLVA